MKEKKGEPAARRWEDIRNPATEAEHISKRMNDTRIIAIETNERHAHNSNPNEQNKAKAEEGTV